MEKVVINGKEYQLDVEKAKKQGFLKESVVDYPKTWEEFSKKQQTCWELVGRCFDIEKYEENIVEAKAFRSLGKLIQLRDWWWDNMCSGWRPESDGKCKYSIKATRGNVTPQWQMNEDGILLFPTEEVRDLFSKTYADLIESAKMFL